MAGKKKSQKHVHKYRKVELKYCGYVFACSLPDCSHHMPSHMEPLLIGRASICWECDKEFPLTEENLKEELPTCIECKQPVNSNAMAEIDKIFNR